MTDTKNPSDKTLSVTPKTLTLKRPVEQGMVRQSFSHGRSKAVVVEKVKRRVLGPDGKEVLAAAPAPAAPPARAPQPSPAAPAPSRPQQAPSGRPQPPRGAGLVLRTLTEDERGARNLALVEARKREEEDRKRAETEAQARAEREAHERAERDEAETRKREEEDRKRQEDDRKRRSEDDARRRLAGEAPAPRAPETTLRDAGQRPPRLDHMGRAPREERPAQSPSTAAGAGAEPSRGPRPAGGPGDRPRPSGGFDRGPAGGRGPDRGAPSAPGVERGPGLAARGAPGPRPGPVIPDEDDPEARARALRRAGVAVKPATVPKTPKVGETKSRGRLTLTNALAGDDERTRSVAAFKRRMQRLTGQRSNEPKEKIQREVTVPETITIQELANRMAERGVDVVRLLMKQGLMVKITDTIDADTAQLVAEEMGHTVKRVAESDVEEGLFDTPDIDDHVLPRSPVVTIMGHVDHGKTSLLDAIRQANVVSGEAGGITQHIGAYQVTSPTGSKITFIDTPGHAAFTQMRARGAKVTDVVVLVVAADDGVMPQTVEAINHAKAAKVPLIVAINKIDKPDANPQRVRTELLQYEIQVESLGGEVQDVEVSAKNQTNLEGLLEAIALQAELLDLKANSDRPAEGTVIEAKLDRGRGTVATVLVQRGTLRVGDIVVAGSEWGRVRALIDDKGGQLKEAGPSVPVEVLGFTGTPDAGDRVAVVESEARAREVTAYRARVKREKTVARQSGARGSLADMMTALKEGAGRKEFVLVIKGDVQGSVEAIIGALEKLGNDEVRARVLHSGVGGITESDITLAEASKAAVIGFNVRAHKEAREAAERDGIEIRYYNIIYDLVDDVKAAMSGMLAPTLREERLGEAQILEVFNVSKVGKVAGCRVLDGVVQRGANVRLIRDNVVIHEGKLSTLQRFKDQVAEVKSGQECGMSFETYQDMRQGDVIECYRVEEVQRSL